jgi:hypothetical protein
LTKLKDGHLSFEGGFVDILRVPVVYVEPERTAVKDVRLSSPQHTVSWSGVFRVVPSFTVRGASVVDRLSSSIFGKKKSGEGFDCLMKSIIYFSVSQLGCRDIVPLIGQHVREEVDR